MAGEPALKRELTENSPSARDTGVSSAGFTVQRDTETVEMPTLVGFTGAPRWSWVQAHR